MNVNATRDGLGAEQQNTYSSEATSEDCHNMPAPPVHIRYCEGQQAQKQSHQQAVECPRGHHTHDVAGKRDMDRGGEVVAEDNGQNYAGYADRNAPLQ